jgi:hypothetical protein
MNIFGQAQVDLDELFDLGGVQAELAADSRPW